MIISIEAVGGWPKLGVSLRVDDVSVKLSETANVQWAILDEDGKITAGPARASLTPEQYNAWGEDDGWVATCIAENLGLVPTK